MPTHIPRRPGGSEPDESTDPLVLNDTQAYLDSRHQGRPPDPRLVESWERFYRFCAPRIREVVVSYRLPESDRDDCIQEVWRTIVLRLPEFRHDPQRGRLRTWLYALTRNKVVDLIRRRVRHSSASLDADASASLRDPDPSPADDCERRWAQAMVQRVLRDLSEQVSEPNYRILRLRWFEGRTLPEIASELGLTPKQVRFRHHRVKEKFRKLFEATQGDRSRESG